MSRSSRRRPTMSKLSIATDWATATAGWRTERPEPRRPSSSPPESAKTGGRGAAGGRGGRGAAPLRRDAFPGPRRAPAVRGPVEDQDDLAVDVHTRPVVAAPVRSGAAVAGEGHLAGDFTAR